MPTLDSLDRGAVFCSDDARATRAVAATWARARASRGLFLMAGKLVAGTDVWAQVRHVLA